MRYLVDGHNLIGKLPDLSLQDMDDEPKLIQRLHVFAQRIGTPIAVVFDPGSNYVPPQRQSYSDVKASYAKRDKTADQLIITRVRNARNPREITVVTSDRALAGRVRVLGAGVISSDEFVRIMQPADSSPDVAELEAEERANVHLDPKEVDEWLDLFSGES